MKSVLVRLEEYLPRASGAEKGALKLLLESPETAVNCSIQQLANKSFTSASTVIRLCRKMGFDGYKEFHKALLCEVAVRKDTRGEETREIEREDGLENIVQKVTYRNIQSLENTCKLMDLNTLSNCVNLINSADSLLLFGMGASLLVARDVYLKFTRVNKTCYFCDDWHMQLLHAKNSTPKDVALAISYSGVTEEVVRCAKEAKSNKTPVIAITRFEASILAKLADYNLYVATTEVFSRIGAMSSRISQFNVVDILYSAYVNQNYDECVPRIVKTRFAREGEDITWRI
ncbi:MurR/RpiR family transcriptional regulator [Hungatella sp. L12]|uniref:MurR/RpiR family transcriptional regulator n=2 Tax=Hungatella TaxID=1649459 RepID=A0ABR7GZK4_9FIRM|nr:MurR/RpiR family transcriptional regulator [Hungatella hominis]MBC5706361.1 MurR/RpiR family transcriptional regulator [Hungatella hominis]